MHDAIKKETFRQLLGNRVVSVFAQKALTESYMECAGERAGDMHELIQRIFAMLVDSRRDEGLLRATVAYLQHDVLKKDDPSFWFNRLYKSYQRQDRPLLRLQGLQPWLLGERILDMGCGDGLTGAMLQRKDYLVCLADVLDSRDELARDLPFFQMGSPRSVPSMNPGFDVSLLFDVLHYVPPRDLAPLMGELRQVSRRVIVEEDCYDIPNRLPGLTEASREDTHLRSFLALSSEDQLRYLMFVDYFASIVTQRELSIVTVNNFRTVREWQAFFAAQGFKVRETLFRGFQKGIINRSCQVWFILDRP